MSPDTFLDVKQHIAHAERGRGKGAEESEHTAEEKSAPEADAKIMSHQPS